MQDITVSKYSAFCFVYVTVRDRSFYMHLLQVMLVKIYVHNQIRTCECDLALSGDLFGVRLIL